MKPKSVIILLLGIILLAACDKIFVDTEGFDAEIQGKWQLTSDHSVYYNFQNNLFEYQCYIQKDSMLSVFGYYTLLGDTGIYLELTPNYTNINTIDTVYPLDFLNWDTIHSNAGTDTLVQYFSISKPNKNEIKLSNQSKNYIFHKF